MSRKIVDLTEYKDNQEDIEMMTEAIPDEVLEAYMKEVENSTPELWSEIETGYEKELMSIDNERRLRKKKTIGIIAAAALITLIAVPVAILSNRSSKSDNTTTISHKDDDTTEAMQEFYDNNDEAFDMYEDASVKEEAAGEDNAVQNQNADMTDSAGDDSEEEYIDESLFAAEINVDGIVYDISDKALIQDIPEAYNNELNIDNIYCDYPEEILTVYKMQDNDAAVYVTYYGRYKLYIKRTESTLANKAICNNYTPAVRI